MERQRIVVRIAVRAGHGLLARGARRAARVRRRHRAGDARGRGAAVPTPTARRSAASRSSSPRCARPAPEPEHVVRTRIFATSADDFEEVARAHGEVFGDVAAGLHLRRHAAPRPALAGRDRGGGADRVKQAYPAVDHRQGRRLRRGRQRARPQLRQGRPVHARRRGGVHAPRRGDVRPRPAHRHRARRGRRARARGADQPRADAVGDRDHDARSAGRPPTSSAS